MKEAAVKYNTLKMSTCWIETVRSTFHPFFALIEFYKQYLTGLPKAGHDHVNVEQSSFRYYYLLPFLIKSGSEFVL